MDRKVVFYGDGTCALLLASLGRLFDRADDYPTDVVLRNLPDMDAWGEAAVVDSICSGLRMRTDSFALQRQIRLDGRDMLEEAVRKAVNDRFDRLADDEAEGIREALLDAGVFRQLA